MTKVSEKILGTLKSGFGNTVPMMGTTGRWGVWNVLEEKFVNKTWAEDAESAIIAFDDETMARINGKKAPKAVGVKVAAKKSNKAPIVRERNGEKLETAKKILSDAPENAKVGDLIKIARKQMPDVSAANFRFLFDKLQGRR